MDKRQASSARTGQLAKRMKMGLAGRWTSTQKGLAECQEMDKQLAEVAVAKFGDLVEGILEETLQAVDFFNLIRMRRVSKNWYASVSRDSAPFQRHVVLALTPAMFAPGLFQYLEPEVNFWQFAKNAVSVLMFETPQMFRPYNLYIDCIWSAYLKQAAADGRAAEITRVIYANMSISSNHLKHLATGRGGFRTVMYHVSLSYNRHELFDESHRGSNRTPLFGVRYGSSTSTGMSVRISGRESFVRSKSSKQALTVDKANGIANLIQDKVGDNSCEKYAGAKDCGLEHFVLRSVVRLNGCSLNQRFMFMEKYTFPGILRELVKRLLKRFDPDNQKASVSFNQNNLRHALQEAHPMVLEVLLQLIRENHGIGF